MARAYLSGLISLKRDQKFSAIREEIILGYVEREELAKINGLVLSLKGRPITNEVAAQISTLLDNQFRYTLPYLSKGAKVNSGTVNSIQGDELQALKEQLAQAKAVAKSQKDTKKQST